VLFPANYKCLVLTFFQSATATEAEIKELLVQITRIVDLEEKQMAYVIESKPHFDKIHCSGNAPSPDLGYEV